MSESQKKSVDQILQELQAVVSNWSRILFPKKTNIQNVPLPIQSIIVQYASPPPKMVFRMLTITGKQFHMAHPKLNRIFSRGGTKKSISISSVSNKNLLFQSCPPPTDHFFRRNQDVTSGFGFSTNKKACFPPLNSKPFWESLSLFFCFFFDELHGENEGSLREIANSVIFEPPFNSF